jgi:hypothetical protein
MIYPPYTELVPEKPPYLVAGMQDRGKKKKVCHTLFMNRYMLSSGDADWPAEERGD